MGGGLSSFDGIRQWSRRRGLYRHAGGDADESGQMAKLPTILGKSSRQRRMVGTLVHYAVWTSLLRVVTVYLPINKHRAVQRRTWPAATDRSPNDQRSGEKD